MKRFRNLFIVVFILFALIFTIGVGRVGGDAPAVSPYENIAKIAYEPSYVPVPVETFDPSEFKPFPDPTTTPTPVPVVAKVKKHRAKPATKPIVYRSKGWRWPIRGRLTTYFSGRHHGVDIAGDCGTPVRATKAGRVSFAGWNSFGGGRDVKIRHAGGYVSDYAHLSRDTVYRGQVVGKGQLIGYRGRTGNATGCHLHFAITRNGYFVNPLRYLP
jgi:murein DD-endopeptidase MepM/ murein hydrolase activator NlpD